MAFYTREELLALGFKSLGRNVLISDKASIYGADKIEIGDNVRIDDFAVLSAGAGGIRLGNYLHIAVFTSLIGAGRIELGDYVNVSSRVAIYSSNDDYSGAFMTNPMVPSYYTRVESAPVTLQKHVIVGCGAVILPGLTIGEGCAIGALSLVRENCPEWSVLAGAPAKVVKARKQDLLALETQLLADG